MKRQIISRAFYGWLTYTKHVNIVRRHLTGSIRTVKVMISILCHLNLISDINILDAPVEDERLKEGLTSDVWKNLISSTERGSSEQRMKEIHARIYYGGVEDSIRFGFHNDYFISPSL